MGEVRNKNNGEQRHEVIEMDRTSIEIQSNIIGISEDRQKHILSVAEYMRDIARNELNWGQNKQNEMFILGYLHDIGYAFTDDPLKHAKIGGGILKEQGYIHYKEVYHHGQPNSPYKSPALDILNRADMQVDEKGNRVSIHIRLESIKLRYGENSEIYKNAVELSKEIKEKWVSNNL